MGRTPSPRRREERDLRERWDHTREREFGRREERRDDRRERGRFNKARSRSRSVERRRRSPDRGRRSPSPFRRRKSPSPGPSKSKGRTKELAIGERPIITPQDLEERSDRKRNGLESEKKNYSSSRRSYSEERSSRRSVVQVYSDRKSCIYCSGKHKIHDCDRFEKLDQNERKNWVRDNGYCFKCFQFHTRFECSSRNYCSHCKDENHDVLICHRLDMRPFRRNRSRPDDSRCCYCNDDHTLYHCSDFLRKSPAQRKTWAINERLCFRCLRQHLGQYCEASNWCKYCSATHHNTLLCESGASRNDERSSRRTPERNVVECYYCSEIHKLIQCKRFLKLTPSLRKQWLKKEHHCFKCLRLHPNIECAMRFKCDYCMDPSHNTLICDFDAQDEALSLRDKKVLLKNAIKPICSYCSGDHPLSKCKQFFRLTKEQRQSWARKGKCCLRCYSQSCRGGCSDTE